MTRMAISPRLAIRIFENMRALHARRRGGGAEGRHGFAERRRAAERLFRQGVAGGWADELEPALAARVASDHASVMRLLGHGFVIAWRPGVAVT